MSNSIGFDESFYLSRNPDVAAAISRGIFTSGAQHFELNGRFEGRNPNAFFDTSFYLGLYPDVARAGVNPLTHFLDNGAAEGRFSNAFEQAAIDLNGNGGADDFDNAQYLDDYPDVAAAVANGTFTNGYQHFVQFGQFEGRTAVLSNGAIITGPFANSGTVPGAGNTFTLTEGFDQFQGTSGNDTFQGRFADLNGFDNIQGGNGNDTLNLFLDTGATVAVPRTATVNGIETINVFREGAVGDTAVNASGFQGAEAIWQIDNVGAITGLSSGQTAGFRDADVNTTVTYNPSVTSANVVLENVTNNADVTVNGNGLTTVSVTASIDATTVEDIKSDTYNAGLVIALDADTTTDVTTLNLSVSSNVDLRLENALDLVTFNASGSTGGIAIDLSAVPAGDSAIQNANFGAGNDIVVATQESFSADAVSLNLGAGADRLTVTLSSEVVSDVNYADLIITGGAGGDQFGFNAGNIILTEAGDAFGSAMGTVSITDFGAGSDTLALNNYTSFAGSFAASAAVNQAIESLDAGANLYQATQAVASVVASSADSGVLYAQFTFGGSNYVYGDVSGTESGLDTGDLLVSLGNGSLSSSNVVGLTIAQNEFGA